MSREEVKLVLRRLIRGTPHVGGYHDRQPPLP